MGDDILADVLRDRKFEVRYPLASATAQYNVEDLLVRVERLPKDGSQGEVRYGILLDLETQDTGGFGQRLILIEIPTIKAAPKEIQAIQENFIKDYIKEMREKWQSYLKRFDKNGLTVDQFDAQRRFSQSVDGRWQILRGFRLHESVQAPAGTVRGEYEPLAKRVFLSFALAANFGLTEASKLAFPFVSGEEYKITLDWVIPYICFENGDNVSHFDTTLPSPGNEELYFPFHNFQFEALKPEPTTFTAAKDQGTIELEPTYHVPLSYFTYAIDQVESSRAKIQEKLAPYATYVAKLSAAQAILQTHGPLKEKSGAEVAQISLRQESDYDGGVSDDFFTEDHLSEQALGLLDVIEARNIFLQVIEKETQIGRVQGDSVNMEQWAGILADLFFGRGSSPVPGSPPVKFAVEEIYQDLWVHNIDPFGYELYCLKANEVISQSSSGKSVQKNFMNIMVYENPLLKSHSRTNVPKIQLWTDQAYRSANMLTTLWQYYYQHRDADLRARNVAQVRSEIPDPARVINFYRDFIVSRLPAGVRAIDGPLDLVWEVTDEQVEHLVRFLLGDATTADVKVAEQRLVLATREILNGTKGLPEFRQIELLREYTEQVKLELIQGKVPASDLRKVAGIGAKVNFAISLFSFGVAAGTHKQNATGVDNARLVTIGMAVVADFGSLVAHLLRMETQLSLTAVRTGSAIARVGVGIGVVNAAVGGVGGAVGVLWHLYDAVGALKEGRRTDALLDSLSAIGVGTATVGFALSGTLVGSGLIIIGIAVVIIAQAIKFFGTSEVENTTRALYTAALHQGMDSFEFFKKELEAGTVKGPFVTISEKKAVEDLLERIDEFFRDSDTFDLFPKTVTP
jgi:hypothetical protein